MSALSVIETADGCMVWKMYCVQLYLIEKPALVIYQETTFSEAHWSYGLIIYLVGKFIHLGCLSFSEHTGISTVDNVWNQWELFLQSLDNSLPQINRYQLDKRCKNKLRYPLDSDLYGRFSILITCTNQIKEFLIVLIAVVL